VRFDVFRLELMVALLFQKQYY